jgi:hypothetical protein
MCACSRSRCPHAAVADRLGARPQRHGRQAHRLGPAAADGRQPRAGADRPEGGDQEAAHAGRNGRPAVRLEGGQVRQEQRHRLLQGRHDHGRGRRPDEPPRLGPHRQHQGAARQPVAAGHGGGQRRLLPLPRRPGRGGGRRRHLRDPARRLDARPGSDRRRQRARRGHGVQRRAPLQYSSKPGDDTDEVANSTPTALPPMSASSLAQALWVSPDSTTRFLPRLRAVPSTVSRAAW